jgi:hypothetical protein
MVDTNAGIDTDPASFSDEEKLYPVSPRRMLKTLRSSAVAWSSASTDANAGLRARSAANAAGIACPKAVAN